MQLFWILLSFELHLVQLKLLKVFVQAISILFVIFFLRIWMKFCAIVNCMPHLWKRQRKVHSSLFLIGSVRFVRTCNYARLFLVCFAHVILYVGRWDVLLNQPKDSCRREFLGMIQA